MAWANLGALYLKHDNAEVSVIENTDYLLLRASNVMGDSGL